MKHFLRLVSAAVAAGAAVLAPVSFAAEGGSGAHMAVLSDSPALLLGSSQGYLGIDVRDVDAERAAALKLKEPGGAEITTVDHDAPAGAVGLRVHDVILQMNGQAIAGVEQLRRMLRETPAGRTVTFLISRDGHPQNITAQLADRATIEQDAWSKHAIFPDPNDDVAMAPSSHGGNSFFGVLSFGGPSVGVQLDTLGSQLADFFGVKDGQGLLVKHVAENSPASNAGLKAGDVVTKVNGQTMATLSDWAKTLHANRGKQVQLTIFRNHKEETLTMQAGDSKRKGELLLPEGFMDEMGGIDLSGDLAELNDSTIFDADQLRDAIRQSSQAMASVDAQKLAEQARAMADQFKSQKLDEEVRRSIQGIDTQKMRDQMQHQMDEMKKALESLHVEQMY